MPTKKEKKDNNHNKVKNAKSANPIAMEEHSTRTKAEREMDR
jgi:hypothetical protein